jgi:hypothetical protein
MAGVSVYLVIDFEVKTSSGSAHLFTIFARNFVLLSRFCFCLLASIIGGWKTKPNYKRMETVSWGGADTMPCLKRSDGRSAACLQLSASCNSITTTGPKERITRYLAICSLSAKARC